MTDTHEPAEQSPNRRSVLQYFMDQQAKDPDFMNRLIVRLQAEWDDLPAAERDAIAAAQRLVQPENPEERGRSTQAFLLAGYLIHEMDIADDLERQLAEPDAAGGEATTAA